MAGALDAASRAEAGQLLKASDVSVRAAATGLAGRCSVILHPTKAKGGSSLRGRLLALCAAMGVEPASVGLSHRERHGPEGRPAVSAGPAAVAAVIAALERSASSAAADADGDGGRGGFAGFPARPTAAPAASFGAFGSAPATGPFSGFASFAQTSGRAPSAGRPAASSSSSSSSSSMPSSASSATGWPSVDQLGAVGPMSFEEASAPATRARLGACAGFSMGQLAAAGAAVAAAAAEMEDDDVDVDGVDGAGVVELGHTSGAARRRELLRVACSLLVAAERAEDAAAAVPDGWGGSMGAGAAAAASASTRPHRVVALEDGVEVLTRPRQSAGLFTEWEPTRGAGSGPDSSRRTTRDGASTLPARDAVEETRPGPFAVSGSRWGGRDRRAMRFAAVASDDSDSSDLEGAAVSDGDEDADFGFGAGTAAAGLAQAAASMSAASGGARVHVSCPDGGFGVSFPQAKGATWASRR